MVLNSVSAVNLILEINGNSKLFCQLKRHLSPKTVGLISRAVPMQCNAHRMGNSVIYIQTAIEEGLIQAFPDGTFRMNDPITVADAQNILYNNEIIDSDEVVVDTAPITRAEFALKLKEMATYSKRLDFLLDWEKGYDTIIKKHETALGIKR